ncbi:hypothetical protein JZO78_11435 [Enterococcus ureilyticus]|uniref:hypothetical protein n=1 Tax=Enterococcus ureilyticus TaxID=1131292 RepID=UPI001A938807|nr:hypothetical protein [Enterococcus ureilyticus]MBO0446958.1 hypothetical protein [Enterococcus ureilyticus]
MNNIIDFDLLLKLDSNLKDLTSKERDTTMWVVLAYLTEIGKKDVAQPLFDLVVQNSNLHASLLNSNLTASDLVNKSDLSTSEKEILLFYIQDLPNLSGRGSGPQSPSIKRRKPTEKEIKTYSDSIKLWSGIITALASLFIAYNGHETNKINRENIKLQYELKQRELDQKDIELNQLMRELDIKEQK